MAAVYRDDRCAVCGEALPPDHFYCAEHGATVDDRLRALGSGLGRLLEALRASAALAPGIAEQTWAWLEECDGADGDWPPAPAVAATAEAEDIDVDVASDPGKVTLDLRLPLPELLAALAAALDTPDLHRLAAHLAAADGADATH